jgi:hypothetical protein
MSRAHVEARFKDEVKAPRIIFDYGNDLRQIA